MGIFDRFQKTTNTKEPRGNLTEFPKLTTFQSLIPQDNNRNYLEQYILYAYKAGDIISNSILDYQPYLVDQKNEKVENQLLKDLQHFNDYQTWTEARKLMQLHLLFAGVAFWAMEPSMNTNHKKDFFILHPLKVSIKTDKYGLPAYYEYEDGDGKIIRYETNEIVYFRRANLKNWFEGQSVTDPAKFLLNAYSLGAQYNQNLLGNNGIPNLLLAFDGLPDEAIEQFSADFNMRYGTPRNAGKLPAVNTRPEVVQLSNSSKDLEFIEGMKMMRQDILAMFGVPEALVFPSSTNANTKESLKIFQQTVIKPALRLETDVLTEQLIPKYFNNISLKESLAFTFEDPVDQDKVEDANVLSTLVGSRIMTKNEARDELGLPPVEGGDDLSEPDPFNFQAPPRAEDDTEGNKTKGEEMPDDLAKSVADTQVMVKGIVDKLEADKKQIEDDLFRHKALAKAIEQEDFVLETATAVFQEQAKRAIEGMGDENPTLRKLPKKEEEDKIVANAYRPVLTRIISDSNGEANIEIKEALYKVNPKKFLAYKAKSLSPEALKGLEEYLAYFAKELNTKTLGDLKKFVSAAIQENKSMREIKAGMANIFNGYLDGVKNIETLQAGGFYVESVAVTQQGGVVIGSSNRYNAMLEKITQAKITEDARKEALKALRGVIDKTDPVGASVDNLLTSVYNVPKSAGITEKRITTISRTTATWSRNTGHLETYRDNPFIIGKKWKAVGDAFTRGANRKRDGKWDHLDADGQIVGMDEDFVVSGELLSMPGDFRGSAGNVINCRCRTVAVVDES